MTSLDTATKRSALLVASIGSFLMPFMASSLNIAIPAIGKELKVDAILLSWIATAYLLTGAVFLVPFGKLADIYGRKIIFVAGASTFTVASLFCAVSPNISFLIASRVLQGMGLAMIVGTGIAIITAVFPPGERGRALGLNTAAVYLGLSVGPFAGGILTHNFGWRSIFLTNVPLGLTMAAATILYMRSEWTKTTREPFDLRGSIIYGVSLLLFIYGLTLLPAPLGWYLASGGAAGFAILTWWELRVASPVLDVRIFRKNAVFTLSIAATLVNYGATAAVGFLLSLYLQYVKGFNAEHAGLILMSQPIVQTICSPLAGRLSDKREPRLVATAGIIVTMLGLILLVFLDQNTTIGYVTGGLVLLGAGFALFASPNVNAIMSSVEKSSYGVAAGAIGTVRMIGQIMSMAIAMLVFSVYIGRVQITPARFESFILSARIIFALFAALSFFGAIASLAGRRPSPQSLEVAPDDPAKPSV